RAYRLLRDALRDAELVGIARYEARGKAYIMMVRPFETGLAMHQLRYADEVKPWAAVGVEDLDKPRASELDLAHKLIAQLARKTFDPTQFTDDVKRRVEKLLEDKIHSGETIVTPEQGVAPTAVPDLMAALRASLESSPPAKHDRAPARRPRRAAAHRPRARAHGARTKRTHA
ncbi:MAG TPA: Ku protein, partial [Kofleriaceae bacterium]|nr:Ku protein [Kofleriaceae bacterium]